MEKEVILTREGYEKLQEEIEELSTARAARSPSASARRASSATSRENSEYDDAKNEQAMLEAQIAQLEERLRDARVIDPPRSTPTDVVARLAGHDRGPGQATGDVPLVGSAEADPDESRLSNESPIGRAIMGRKKGETVEVTCRAARSRSRSSPSSAA